MHANRTDSRTECPPRVGFVVSKAVGGAVMRNRVKRRLRAASSTLLPALDVGTDLVVRAQPDSAAADFPTLEAELKMLAHKALRQIKVA